MHARIYKSTVSCKKMMHTEFSYYCESKGLDRDLFNVRLGVSTRGSIVVLRLQKGEKQNEEFDGLR